MTLWLLSFGEEVGGEVLSFEQAMNVFKTAKLFQERKSIH
jgi:hypothetical protein